MVYAVGVVEKICFGAEGKSVEGSVISPRVHASSPCLQNEPERKYEAAQHAVHVAHCIPVKLCKETNLFHTKLADFCMKISPRKQSICRYIMMYVCEAICPVGMRLAVRLPLFSLIPLLYKQNMFRCGFYLIHYT